jgi:hypothetical protein
VDVEGGMRVAGQVQRCAIQMNVVGLELHEQIERVPRHIFPLPLVA